MVLRHHRRLFCLRSHRADATGKKNLGEGKFFSAHAVRNV
jgi:hypothetical protein